ncbi:MAG: Gp37 family protein [Saprospiraceae bacterium]
MNYAKLEDAIVQRLEPLKALGFEVVALPDRDADYERPFKFGRVTVAYKSSLFTEDGTSGRPVLYSTSEIVQKETVEVEVVIQSRTLRGEKGVHWLKAAVSKQIIGWQPDSWGRLYGKEYRFVEHADGIFTYALSLFTTGLLVQHDDPKSLPVLSQITVLMGNDPANVITVASDLAAGNTDPDGGVYVFQTGTNFSLKYEFVTPTGMAVNLAGYTFRWGLKQFVTDPDPLLLKTPDPTGNVVYATVGAVENIFTPGTYKSILEVVNPSLVVEQEIVNTIVIEPQYI